MSVCLPSSSDFVNFDPKMNLFPIESLCIRYGICMKTKVAFMYRTRETYGLAADCFVSTILPRMRGGSISLASVMFLLSSMFKTRILRSKLYRGLHQNVGGERISKAIVGSHGKCLNRSSRTSLYNRALSLSQ